MIMAVFAPAHGQWTEPVRIGIPGAYHYPQILAEGNTLHVVGTNIPGGDKVVYLRSDDAGDTWGNSHVLSDTVNSTNAMFVRIVKNGQQIMVFWRSIMNSGPRPWNIGYAISQNNGNTWAGPLYVLNPGWDHVSYFSVSNNANIINIIVSAAPGNQMIFYTVRSTNFGQNWSEPVELFRAAQEIWPDQTSINSLVHFVWSGRFTWEDYMEIFYIQSTDNGISWSPHIALSDSDQYDSQLPAIAGDNSGSIGVTGMDFKYAPPGATGDIFIRQSADSGSFWDLQEQLTFNHYAFGSDIVSKTDTIHIAWEDESQSVFRRRIYYMNSTDNGGSWSHPYWVDGTDDDSWNPAIAVSNGKVYVVWAEYRLDSGYGLYFSRYQYQTGIVEKEPTTPRIEILSAYPNPFNSRVAVSLNMIKGGEAEIEIYDIKGRLVKTIFKGGKLEKGTHKFAWDATGADGKAVSSGLYFAVAGTPQGRITKRLTLIR
jgi:hypothetical protein